jgi:hypothetical protein
VNSCLCTIEKSVIKEIVKDNTEKIVNAKNTLFSLLLLINLFRYWVENKSEVLCKIKVESVKTIAIVPPITEPIEVASPLKASGEITVPSFSR